MEPIRDHRSSISTLQILCIYGSAQVAGRSQGLSLTALFMVPKLYYLIINISISFYHLALTNVLGITSYEGENDIYPFSTLNLFLTVNII